MTAPLRCTVLGAGYLGITHAACLAEMGMPVLCVDTDPGRIERLSRGDLPIFEPGLAELLSAGLRSGRLRFTGSHKDAAAFGEVHFICVGTPQRADGNGADLSQLESCLAMLAPRLDSPSLVVGKSTVPMGTAQRLAAELRRSAPAGGDVELAWNPEFLREGHAVRDTMQPDRLVLGVQSARAEHMLRRVYAAPLEAGAPVIVTNLATAELAKLAANSYLATKISFINAMAEVCEATSADVTVLASILGSDPRIGPAFLRPGLGFGGGCLPKDIRAFTPRATELGAGKAVAFLREVDAINLRLRASIANLACELAGGSLAGTAVGILGVAFKPGTDDVRDSPALDVAQMLHAMGARVSVFDPAAMPNARALCPQLYYAGSAREAARDAQLLLLLTEWPQFINLNPSGLDVTEQHIATPGVAELGEALGLQRAVIDARHVLDAQRWRAAGWRYRALGVPPVDAARPDHASDGGVYVQASGQDGQP